MAKSKTEKFKEESKKKNQQRRQRARKTIKAYGKIQGKGFDPEEEMFTTATNLISDIFHFIGIDSLFETANGRIENLIETAKGHHYSEVKEELTGEPH